MTRESVALVCFGRGGHTEQMRGIPPEHSKGYGPTLSGYDSPENWTPDADKDYSDCWVINKHPALDAAGDSVVALVVMAPMCNVDLDDDTIDLCPEPSPIMASAMEGEFRTLLAAQQAHRKSSIGKQAGPLDQVSRTRYIEFWRDHGAQIGRVLNGRIEWMI